MAGQTPQSSSAPGKAITLSHDAAMGERAWSSSILDCLKPLDMCCFACWCPCVLYGKTHQRLEDPSLKDYLAVNKCCAAQCCLQVGGLAWVLPMVDRADLRQRYGLKGSGCDDFLRAFFCGGLVLLQHEKELISLTEAEAQQPNTQGYQSQPGMTYAT